MDTPKESNPNNEIKVALELDSNSAIFLTKLNKMWNLSKKSPQVVDKLHQHFNISENPYEETIRLMCNCEEFNTAKSNSLPYFIIQEFKNWTSTNQNKINLLTPQLKIATFQVVSTQNSQNLTKLVAEVYEMGEAGYIFLDTIKRMIQEKRYQEACQSAVLFKLQAQFTVEDFLLPLILQDKLYGTDDFLTTSPKHQTEIITLLDAALGEPSVKTALMRFVTNLNVPDVKLAKLDAKSVKKLVSRYVKMFKLSSDLTPNCNKRAKEGQLRFLLHKRYVDRSGEESFKEMVREAIGDDEALQRELVVQVCTHDVAEALSWARFYKIDKHYWPEEVRTLEENPEERAHQRNSEHLEYHEFPLPTSTIHLVDSEESFQSFLDSGLQDVEIVGIDCEWKPNLTGKKTDLALMQLATRQNVFLLDVTSLAGQVAHLWQQLGESLFNNRDIVKLGFGLAGDISVIKKSLRELKFAQKQGGFLDLLSFWELLGEFPEVVLPNEVQSSKRNLGTLVHRCLGRPLDKSDQFSNWERRPLRESQLIYAALDAYCLIQVYDVLKSCCENAGFQFEEACNIVMMMEKVNKEMLKKLSAGKANEEIAQPR